MRRFGPLLRVLPLGWVFYVLERFEALCVILGAFLRLPELRKDARVGSVAIFATLRPLWSRCARFAALEALPISPGGIARSAGELALVVWYRRSDQAATSRICSDPAPLHGSSR